MIRSQFRSDNQRKLPFNVFGKIIPCLADVLLIVPLMLLVLLDPFFVKIIPVGGIWAHLDPFWVMWVVFLQQIWMKVLMLLSLPVRLYIMVHQEQCLDCIVRILIPTLIAITMVRVRSVGITSLHSVLRSWKTLWNYCFLVGFVNVLVLIIHKDILLYPSFIYRIHLYTEFLIQIWEIVILTPLLRVLGI